MQPTSEGEPYTQDELDCMAAAIYNEAGSDSCTNEQRKLVGYVVLNRVNDPRFPDTICEVLEQPGQYVEGASFAKRSSKDVERHAVERAYDVAREVLENRNEIPIPATVVFQAQFKQGTGVYKQIGNTYFCYAEEVS